MYMQGKSESILKQRCYPLFCLFYVFFQWGFSVMLLLFKAFLIKCWSPPHPLKGMSLATNLQQEMHTWCHFHYFWKYCVTLDQVCIHFLIFFSNIVSYSTFLVYSLYCFALQISTSVEYDPFFLRFCLLFPNSEETSQWAASFILWNPALKAFCKI